MFQELEFLTDSSVITPAQLSDILSQLPSQTQVHAPLSPPTDQLSNVSLNEKNSAISPYPSPAPPPAYASSPPVLSIATALYAFTPTDAGDLALQAHDRIQVLEHMNNDCTSSSLLVSSCSNVGRYQIITLLKPRVAWSKRTHQSRRHISPILCQRG
jgi:hypothetical protein